MAKINIDFQVINSNDPQVLMVVDNSIWENLESKPSIIEIIMPGFKEPMTHFFDKGRMNSFNSYNLGMNCNSCREGELLNLPDGVYEITLKGSPSNFFKNRLYLKTDLFQLEFDKLFIKALANTNSDTSKSIFKELMDVKNLISGAEALLRQGDNCNSQSLLDKAMKKVNKLKNCKTCV